MSRFLVIILFGVSSAQFNDTPAVSEINGTATLSWQIPTGGLDNLPSLSVVSPGGYSAFVIITPIESFTALANYIGRVEYMGNLTNWNMTFILRNIRSDDAGRYWCGNGGMYPTRVIRDCGQMLVVLDKPTKPVILSSTIPPVYMKQVTLTCNSTSTSLPKGHGLPLIYTWQRNGTIMTSDPGASFTFTISSRDPHNYRCRAEESRGLESDWSDMYRMEPEYGPYQETLTPPGLSYTVRENQTSVPPISCSANCKPACTYLWQKNATILSNSAVLNLGQSSRSQRGSYRCQAFNDRGSVYTSSVSVNVQYPSEVHLKQAESCRPYKVFDGQQNVQLLCEVTSSNPEVTSFIWRHNNSVLSSASSHVLTINITKGRSGGTYSCQGHNGISGSPVSQSLTLDVQYRPKVSVPSVLTVQEGKSLSVRCEVDANPTASVSWTKKTDSSFTRTASVLQFINIQQDEAGEYVCSGTNTITPCGQTAFSWSGEEDVTVNVQAMSPPSKFVTGLGVGVGVTVPVVVVLVVVIIVTCRKRNTADKNQSANRKPQEPTIGYGEMGPAAPVDRSPYASLDYATVDDTNRTQEYNELTLYYNTKKRTTTDTHHENQAANGQ